jgi:hypothetical protein
MTLMAFRILSVLGSILLLAAGSAANAGSLSAAEIHQQIQQTYNFQPHLLQKQEVDAKSQVLDQFWERAKSNRADYIPALRQELADFSNPLFFLYDGSVLLLSLSDTPADRKVALAAMAHCDLLDVQHDDYFHQVHRMAVLGEDTIAAAFHVLDDPHYQVVVPQHALTLGQNYVLVYLLLPTDQRYWEQPAIDRLARELDETSQRSLLLLLWYAQTEAADQAIAGFARDAARPAASRSYAEELMRGKSAHRTLSRTATLLSLSSEETLRKKRRERLKAVSDEALIDLDTYTELLMAKRKRN